MMTHHEVRVILIQNPVALLVGHHRNVEQVTILPELVHLGLAELETSPFYCLLKIKG